MNLKSRIVDSLSFPDSDFKTPLTLSLIGVFFMPVSLTAMQLFLGAAVIIWIVQSIKSRSRPHWNPVFYYILGFMILSSISIIFSLDIESSLKLLKKIPIILIPIFFYNILDRREYIGRFLWSLYLGAFFNSLAGAVMYFLGKQHRLSGFLGHYMTMAGILMMVIIILLARMLTIGIAEFGFKKTMLLITFSSALLLTLTRSSWVGAFLGFLILFAVIQPKYVPLGVVLLLLAFFIMPSNVKSRIASTFDLQDTTIQERIKMVKIGQSIIRDYPLFGVGPEMVKRVYAEYQISKEDTSRPHLHNNFIQIAAERGLLTLTAWIAFLISASYYLIQIYRKFRKSTHHTPAFLSIGALVVIVSFLTAGLFEFNWGDTEVEVVFLFLLTLPLTFYKRIPGKSRNNAG